MPANNSDIYDDNVELYGNMLNKAALGFSFACLGSKLYEK